MSIDLRSMIRDDKTVRSGGYSGAIFLTYTLNLTFYEQMIAPALDQAGCANVLILVDPDGYNGALEMGLKSIQGAGLRYVCVPLPRTGRGVQHAKLLMMAGSKHGRLFIGSGNLTMHGYGRNLELYSNFEYEANKDQLNDTYPFIQVWQLVKKITSEYELPISARHQIKIFQETVPWLSESIAEPFDFRVWHNFDVPIIQQLKEWRISRGWTNLPIQKIQAISPYYDAEIGAVKRLADDFIPDQIQIYLDPALTNLNGTKAKKAWSNREVGLIPACIGPGEETNSSRHVHAKALIGREQNGVWCITGSANLTVPALLKSWQNQGNLELVTFQWSPDLNAFDYLFTDSYVRVWLIDLSDIIGNDQEPSERAAHVDSLLMLTDLTARGVMLEGRLSFIPDMDIANGNLHLLRNKLDIPITLDRDLAFRVSLPAPLEKAEAARLEFGDSSTPYRWIDQPEILARYGARTYQVRIKGKMETILGAEQLFQELMNYLWERVDPSRESNEQDPRIIRRQRKKSGDHSDSSDVPLPEGPEDFITDEVLVRTLNWGVESHQPYDRSLLSLRDLLSLALLRLTTPTQPASPDEDAENRDEDADQRRQTELEEQRIKIIDRLRNYLFGYCKRYGRLVGNPDFIRHKAPELIFQNHFTLSRVILEFAAKAGQVFTQDDLTISFWWIWAPLVWPGIIGLDNLPALKILEKEFKPDRIQQAWKEEGMPNISVTMISETFGNPPSWRAGLWNKKRVGEFMAVREWIARIRNAIGVNAFHIIPQTMDHAFGVRSLEDVTSISPQANFPDLNDYLTIFDKIEKYLPPVQEKYAPLIQLSEINQGNGDTQLVQGLIEQIHQQGLLNEYQEYRKKPVRIIPTSDDDFYCPKCGALLTLIAQNRLKQGKLVLCTASKDSWIYLVPKLPKSVI